MALWAFPRYNCKTAFVSSLQNGRFIKTTAIEPNIVSGNANMNASLKVVKYLFSPSFAARGINFSPSNSINLFTLLPPNMIYF
ncbi:hypothetical protein LM601614_40449 [Listeria monocytogenes]|nr:hypothetical protein LM601614_40449 [Listeria monocytogenes]